MGHPEDERSSPAPRQQRVGIRPEDVLEVARTTRTKARDLEENHQFKNLHLTDDVFGGIGSARALVHLHGSAHRVVSDTIAEVSVQLTAYADGLEKSVSDLAEIEAQSGTALDTLTLRSIAQVRGGDMGDAARREAEARYAPEQRGEVPGLGDQPEDSDGTDPSTETGD